MCYFGKERWELSMGKMVLNDSDFEPLFYSLSEREELVYEPSPLSFRYFF
jgi:hypothetical protein